MKLDITEKLSLAFLGEGWEECYISFSALTVGMAKKFRQTDESDPELLDKGVSLLKELFVEGKVLSGGEIKALKKDDLDDLPVTILNRAVTLLANSMNEEKKENS